MAGEEVVGGVVGFLRMDIGDFERDMLKALALVKALDGQDINIDVKTNSKSVEKDLGGVGRAAKGAGREVDGMGGSFKGLRDPRVIVGALAGGMALLGPVTGAATAAVGGLVGVVGTGILAFQGFKKEIKDGTELGKSLQSGLDGVKGAFSDLGTVAAHAMSGGVLDSLATLRTQLPGLSGDVKTLGARLGNALSISTKGLVSGLQNMMPLLQDGGRYAEQLAQKFADFTQSQDFKDFVEYSRRMLPEVASALGDVAKGVISVASSLSDEGEGMVETVGALGKALQVLGVASDLDGVRRGNNGAVIESTKMLAEWTHGSVDATAAADLQASALAGLGVAQSATATTLGTTDQALNTAREAQGKHTAAAAAATLQMQVEGNAAGLLKQSLDLLNGKTLDLSSAQTSAASATLSAVDALKKSKGGLDLTTAAGITARQSIEGKARADQAMAEATAKATGKTADGVKSLKDSKAALEAAMKKQGLLTGEVQKYIDKLYQVPKSVPPTKLEVQTAGALAGIAAFQKAIDLLHGKTVGVQTRYTYSGKLPNGGVGKGGGSTFDAGAKGGLISNGIKRYDSGGLISGPGTGTSDSILAAISGTQEMIRVANGEFISTDASRRRNRAALEAGNKGAALAVAGAGGGSVKVDQHFYGPNAREVAAASANSLTWALRKP